MAACGALGRFYLQQPEYGKSLARAHSLLAHACDRKWAEACTDMGEVARLEDGRDRRKFWAFYRTGCELGDSRGCERFARAQMADRFSGDRTQAEQALAKACAAERLSSCHLLAQMLVRNPATLQEGVRLLGQNCKRGFAGSCTQGAGFSAPLLSAYPDCRRALPLASAACAAKDDDGCAIEDRCNAELQVTGAQSGTITGPNPVERLEQLCAKNSALGCLYWADAQTGSQAIAADPGRVRGAYLVACRGGLIGSGIGCVRIHLMDLAEAKTRHEAEPAISSLRDACKESFGEACCKLADVYRKGQWVTADEAQAAEFQSKACDLKEKSCCSPLAPQ